MALLKDLMAVRDDKRFELLLLLPWNQSLAGLCHHLVSLQDSFRAEALALYAHSDHPTSICSNFKFTFQSAVCIHNLEIRNSGSKSSSMGWRLWSCYTWIGVNNVIANHVTYYWIQHFPTEMQLHIHPGSSLWRAAANCLRANNFVRKFVAAIT